MSTPIEACVAALRDAGWTVHETVMGSYYIPVSDAGDDDPEAEESLAEIQEIAAAHGCQADWADSGNTDSDGKSTSDVFLWCDVGDAGGAP